MASIGEQASETLGSAEPPSAPGLFVREASGLVREMGTRDAFTVGISQVNMATALTVIFSALALFPRSDLLVPLLLGAAAAAVMAVVYAQLTAAMPRTGGDYIFISRVLHPALGSIFGMAVLWFTIISVGLNALLFAPLFFPFLLTTLGSTLHIPALSAYASTVASSHGWEFAWGALTIVASGVLSGFSVRTLARTSFWMVVAGSVAFVLMVVELALQSPSSFRHAFSAASGNASAYKEMIALAARSGIPTGASASGTIAATALVVLIWFGTAYPAITGGELKRPGLTALRGQLWTIGLSVVTLAIGYEVLRHVLGFHFLQSAAGLATADPGAYGHLTNVPGFLPSYAALLLPDPVSKVFIAVGFNAFTLALIVMVLFVGSRMLFALSFDRILPTRLSSVDSRRNAPVWAVATMVIIGIGFLAAYVFSSSIASAFRNSVLILASDFVMVALVGVVLPFRKRDLWAASPKIVSARWLGVPAYCCVSALALVIFGLVVYFSATKSQISGGYDVASVCTLAASPAAGLIAYLVARAGSARRGIDFKLAMQELPPD